METPGNMSVDLILKTLPEVEEKIGIYPTIPTIWVRSIQWALEDRKRLLDLAIALKADHSLLRQVMREAIAAFEPEVSVGNITIERMKAVLLQQPLPEPIIPKAGQYGQSQEEERSVSKPDPGLGIDPCPVDQGKPHQLENPS